VVMAVFSFGPVLRAGDNVVFDPAPYRWLMNLPGFLESRVPTRFWLLGSLSLAAACGLAFANLFQRRPAPGAGFLLVAAGLLVDGWLNHMPMADAPLVWEQAEPRKRTQAILELPLGPDWDGAATFRSIAHRRPVFNGVSGYDPAHYAPLQAGLNDHDP